MLSTLTFSTLKENISLTQELARLRAANVDNPANLKQIISVQEQIIANSAKALNQVMEDVVGPANLTEALKESIGMLSSTTRVQRLAQETPDLLDANQLTNLYNESRQAIHSDKERRKVAIRVAFGILTTLIAVGKTGAGLPPV